MGGEGMETGRAADGQKRACERSRGGRRGYAFPSGGRAADAAQTYQAEGVGRACATGGIVFRKENGIRRKSYHGEKEEGCSEAVRGELRANEESIA